MVEIRSMRFPSDLFNSKLLRALSADVILLQGSGQAEEAEPRKSYVGGAGTVGFSDTAHRLTSIDPLIVFCNHHGQYLMLFGSSTFPQPSITGRSHQDPREARLLRAPLNAVLAGLLLPGTRSSWYIRYARQLSGSVREGLA
jgi:hypothetical protein